MNEMLRVLALACAAALPLAFSETRAAPQSGPQPVAPETKPESAAAPNATNGEATKPGEGPIQPEPAQSTSDDGLKSLGELTRDGFEIRTTAFIPAEAVTRQSGKVSSDAIVVTLQKSAATAICFYTLKAYVGKKMTTIPACTVHR
ncbi:MAG TPA: hypothetical protein VNJ31_08655 [Methyloceanibacter sp.]|nr:hypothetical protein [Methyloceanibacter sp.]